MLNPSIYSEITGKIIGAAMEVHRTLGFGFLEQVYQNALFKELKDRNMSFLAQRPVEVHYKQEKIGVYIPDFIIQNTVIVEIKAQENINLEQIQAQIINYLVATKKEVGLYLNFGEKSLKFKRYLIPKKFQSDLICS